MSVPLHRDEQINLLNSLFQCSSLPVSLFLYGLPGTGKTLTISNLLQKRKDVTSASINCTGVYIQRVLWEPVLNQIAGYEPTSRNGFAPFMKCDTLCDFVEGLARAVEERCGNREAPVCVVFDHAEKLRDMDDTILSSLLRLREFTGLNICTVLISNIPFEKFRSGTGFREPFQIHFTQYKKDEVIDIMSLDRPGDWSEDFYKNYVRLLLSVFWTVCRDLSELRYMARMNFGRYCRPVVDGEAQESDQMKLWKNAEPIFRKSLTAIYSRDVSSVLEENPEEAELGIESRMKMALDLPFFTKYLLIAAFLASYNPSKYDKRLFVKHHGKQKKSKAFIAQKEKYNSQLLGPKPFPLDRLLAIFYSIVEDKVAPTANIFSQVTSLVTLRLINRIGVNVLENPKYRCAVSLDFIRYIARTVSFDIIPYLYDRGLST